MCLLGGSYKGLIGKYKGLGFCCKQIKEPLEGFEQRNVAV